MVGSRGSDHEPTAAANDPPELRYRTRGEDAQDDTETLAWNRDPARHIGDDPRGIGHRSRRGADRHLGEVDADRSVEPARLLRPLQIKTRPATDVDQRALATDQPLGQRVEQRVEEARSQEPTSGGDHLGAISRLLRGEAEVYVSLPGDVEAVPCGTTQDTTVGLEGGRARRAAEKFEMPRRPFW
jgi:hypothetical protein